MKVLILCPLLKYVGGVSNHYLGLKPYWNEDVEYQEIGKRNGKKGNGKLWIIIDIFKLLKNLLVFRPDIILLNPSIAKNALQRDFLLQRISNLFGFKTSIFIHGFDLPTFEAINKHWLKTNLNKSSLIFVLAKSFKNLLEGIGVTIPIAISTTKVDDRLIKDFDLSKKNRKQGDLLFLSRIERAKGVYETIEAFKILKNDYPKLKLKIVGTGSELDNIIKKIKSENIKDIIITGVLTGKDIANTYRTSIIYIFPTHHGEGLPTTVLEAMAFGLPVITRPVGGIVDFFVNHKMGVIEEDLSPSKIAEIIHQYLDNEELLLETEKYNYKYASSNFMASKVARNIESELSKYIK